MPTHRNLTPQSVVDRARVPTSVAPPGNAGSPPPPAHKPAKPDLVLAVYEHIEGDEEGNRRRKAEAVGEMMREALRDDGER